MIRVRCDRCEKLLEAPDDLAGQRIECPACGDVRVLPATESGVAGAGSGLPRTRLGASESTAPPAKPEPADRAVAAGYPPDSGPEQTVMVVRPVMFRARLGLTLLMMAGAVAAIVGMVYFGGVHKHTAGFWGSVGVFAVCLLFLGVWRIDHLGTKLTITNKRSVARRGLISKATTEVFHDHVRNVQITQSAWQRLIGIGRIGLSSSADDDIEIVMDDLPSPDRIRRVIDLYRPM